MFRMKKIAAILMILILAAGMVPAAFAADTADAVWD